MHVEIIYQGERLFIGEAQIEGYAGCEIVARHAAMPADDIHAQVSPEHLGSVHLQKAIEAVLILSGHQLSAGLLAEEAEALGIGIEDLARQVLAHRRAERDYEIARRIHRRDSRNGGRNA